MAKERPKRTGIMLAYPLDDGRLARLGEKFIVQPKLNGERAIVEYFDGDPVLVSSYGNEFKFMDHILDQIRAVNRLVGDIPFDGEIYVHGWPREEIDSALRRKVNKSDKTAQLQYHIFDVRTPDPTTRRLSFLQSLYERVLKHHHFLQHVPAGLISQDVWMDWAAQFVALGYEGIMLRKLDAPWVDKRTVTMLKFKPTEEEQYEITSVQEAIDKYGHPKGMVGSFTVRSQPDEETFDVGAGKLSHDKRIQLWQIRDTLPGRRLLVKHEILRNSGGVPLCAVAVDVL